MPDQSVWKNIEASPQGGDECLEEFRFSEGKIYLYPARVRAGFIGDDVGWVLGDQSDDECGIVEIYIHEVHKSRSGDIVVFDRKLVAPDGRVVDKQPDQICYSRDMGFPN